MTNLRYLIAGVLSIVIISSVQNSIEAYQTLSPRNGYYGQMELDGIDGRGTLHLDGTTVRNSVSSCGTLRAYCAEIGCAGVDGSALLIDSVIHGDLWVRGRALLRHSVVEGTTEMCGTLEACSSVFQDRIQAAADIIDLSNVCAPCIYVFPYGDCCGLQVVKLTNCTHIDGDIIFESGEGRVLIDYTSSINGSVFGGKVCSP